VTGTQLMPMRETASNGQTEPEPIVSEQLTLIDLAALDSVRVARHTTKDRDRRAARPDRDVERRDVNPEEALDDALGDRVHRARVLDVLAALSAARGGRRRPVALRVDRDRHAVDADELGYRESSAHIFDRNTP
jgi:hypothetical protein